MLRRELPAFLMQVDAIKPEVFVHELEVFARDFEVFAHELEVFVRGFELFAHELVVFVRDFEVFAHELVVFVRDFQLPALIFELEAQCFEVGEFISQVGSLKKIFQIYSN